MTRTLEELSLDEIQILEILSEGTFHKYHIFDQIKKLKTYAGKPFKLEEIEILLNKLKNEDFIAYLDNLESYKITELGKELLFT